MRVHRHDSPTRARTCRPKVEAFDRFGEAVDVNQFVRRCYMNAINEKRGQAVSGILRGQ